MRIVDYGAGYVADHWCAKGHILLVVSGALVIEHQDGGRYELAAGMSWLAIRQIGGQTGDVLGAAEQVAETAVLLLLAARLG